MPKKCYVRLLCAAVFMPLVLLFASVGPARADIVGFEAAAGTTGVGGGVRLNLPMTGTTLRLSGGALNFSRNSTYENRVINADVNLALRGTAQIRTVGLTLERMNPWGFGLVGGVYLNNNSIHAVSVPIDSSVVINGATYTQQGAGMVYTDVHWNRVAPYLGFRFAPRALHGAYLEAGGFYQGRARVNFSATGAIAANQSSFQPYYDEETRQLRAELAPVQVYPVFQVGIPLFHR